LINLEGSVITRRRLFGRVRPHTVLLAAIATIVCVRAAVPPPDRTAALAAASTVAVVPVSTEVMVSISGPVEVKPREDAALGTAVHLVADGHAVGGVTVILDRRLSPGAEWTETARAVTDAAGRAVFHATVTRRTDFRAHALPDPPYSAGSSAVITVATR
jgi:hypothetical protein